MGQFGLLCMRVYYRKVSKQASMQASKQASMQVSGHGSNQVLATYTYTC